MRNDVLFPVIDRRINDAVSIVIKEAYGFSNDDSYYIDRQDSIIKNTSSGEDTIYASISYDLGANKNAVIENLVLLNWEDPLKTQIKTVDGNIVPGIFDVYGHPTNIDIDYVQGNEYKDFKPNLNLYEHLELSALPAML